MSDTTLTPEQQDDLSKHLDQVVQDGSTRGDLDVCETYKKVKPGLSAALPLIRLIPFYGAKIANAIEVLLRIADQLCPTE